MPRVTPLGLPGSAVNTISSGGGNFYSPAGAPQAPTEAQLINLQSLSNAFQLRTQQKVEEDERDLTLIGAEVARRKAQGQELDDILKDITESGRSSNRVRAMLQRAAEAGQIETWESPAFQQGFQRVRAEQKAILLDGILKANAGKYAAELAEITDVTKRSQRMAQLIQEASAEAAESIGAHDLGLFGNAAYAEAEARALSGFAADIDGRARRIQEDELVRNLGAEFQGIVETYLDAPKEAATGKPASSLLVQTSTSLANFHKNLQATSVVDKEGKTLAAAEAMINKALIDDPRAAADIAEQLLTSTRIDGHLVWSPAAEARLGAKVVDVQNRAEQQQRAKDVSDSQKRRNDYGALDSTKVGVQIIREGLVGNEEEVLNIAANLSEILADGEITKEEAAEIFGEKFDLESVDRANLLDWVKDAVPQALMSARQFNRPKNVSKIVGQIMRHALDRNPEKAMGMYRANLEALVGGEEDIVEIYSRIEALSKGPYNTVYSSALDGVKPFIARMAELYATDPRSGLNDKAALEYQQLFLAEWQDEMAKSSQATSLTPDKSIVDREALEALNKVMESRNYDAVKEAKGIDRSMVKQLGLDEAVERMEKQRQLEEAKSKPEGLVFGMFDTLDPQRSAVKKAWKVAESKTWDIKKTAFALGDLMVMYETEETEYTQGQVDRMASQLLVQTGAFSVDSLFSSEERGLLTEEGVAALKKATSVNASVYHGIDKIKSVDVRGVDPTKMYFMEFREVKDYIVDGSLKDAPPLMVHRAERFLNMYGLPSGENGVTKFLLRQAEFFNE